MGVCTSDPLGYLIKTYGQDVCKYFVAIKSVQFIDATAPKLAQGVQEQFKTSAGTLDKEFQSRQTTIKTKYGSVIQTIKQSNPTAIDTVKNSQNKTQQQLFGLDSLQNQFNKLKSTKDSKIKQQESNILDLLQEKVQSLKKDINEKKPYLPLFDEMPVCIKQKVLSDGQERFAPEIKSKQEEILSYFDRVTNIGNLQNQIKKASGLNDADKLVKDSDSTFQQAKKMITTLSKPSSTTKSTTKSGIKPKTCFG